MIPGAIPGTCTGQKNRPPERRFDPSMNPYLAFLLYLLAILGFVGTTLVLNRLLGPKPVPRGAKLEPFECGSAPVDPVNVRTVRVKYYGLAVAFLIFDLETVFLILWALAAQPLTDLLLGTYLFFTGLLVLIMLYVWKSGLIEDVTR